MKGDPIRNLKDIRRVEMTLLGLQTARGDRMFLLFEVGIFLGLRIGDMLQMTVGDIRGQESYTFIPQKTDTRKNVKNYRAPKVTVTIPPELRSVVNAVCDGMPDDMTLFPSGRRDTGGRMLPITRKTAWLDMQEIARLCGLKEHVGCHTLRKTFGYHVYQKYHDIAWLQGWYHHSSPAITLVYIGIADDEHKAVTDHMPFGDNRSELMLRYRESLMADQYAPPFCVSYIDIDKTGVL